MNCQNNKIREQWERLLSDFSDVEDTNVHVTYSELRDGVRVCETDYEKEVVFDFTRFFNGKRITKVDLFGVIGLSEFDFKTKYVIVTEGISDYLTLRMIQDKPVLGKTGAGSSEIYKYISHVPNIYVCCDNDVTGMKVGMMYKRNLSRSNVRLIVPTGLKDVTEMYLRNRENEILNTIKKYEK